ncbi:MAG: substrate-binding domain-containing protein, partial [Anaerolineae bacterium]|nr:substrate-binding domain-containing protein [Anaerolineae bacterium]
YERHANLIFETALKPDFFDGLILWTGALDWYVSDEKLNDFVQRFASVPMVGMETPLHGVPLIDFDNYQGMWDLVQHMVVDHDYRQIAYVTGIDGHFGIQKRNQAFFACMQAHGVAVDIDRVVQGEISEEFGKTAVSILLDERQKDFDAVVVATGSLASGVYKALQSRNITVPLHKAMASFDDFPLLTSVNPPFYEMGRAALEACLALIKGETIPDHIEMPTNLIVRRSCGCLPKVFESDFGLLRADPIFVTQIPIHEQMAENLAKIIPDNISDDELKLFSQLFVQSITEGTPQKFIDYFNKVLFQHAFIEHSFKRWHDVILALREYALHYWHTLEFINRVEDVCYQARILIDDISNWAMDNQFVFGEEKSLSLRHIGYSLITVFGLDEVRELVVDQFPEVGIPYCMVALYQSDGGVFHQSELMVGYDENGRFSLPNNAVWVFKESVLPTPLFASNQRRSFIVAPMYFREEDLGLVVFGIGAKDGYVYETLRLQLSSALKRALMVKEIQSAQDELEMRVATRTVELTQEVAKHKKTSEALQQSEATTRALLEAIPDAIFLIDSEGRFLNFMPTEDLKTAVEQTDYLGLTLTDVFPPELAKNFAQAIPQASQTETVLLQEYPVKIGHDTRYYEARLINIGQNNVLGIIRDITERKHNEKEREQLIIELEAKNTELERFTYTVSHDLKSPLVTIKGFLGFLEQDALEGDVEQLHQDVMRIRQAAERMQELLDDLLELSRIGHSMNQPETVPFADIIHEAITRVQGQIEENQVEIIIQPDLPKVSVDKSRIVEVVQNLLDNAVKYMGDQTKPTISIGTEIIKYETCFFVRDNGQGIETKYHEKVFGLFDRLDQSIEGTGIGLAIVKRIIELHKGRIWIESAGKNRGSVFYFTLPLVESHN